MSIYAGRCIAHFRRLPCSVCADQRRADAEAAIADDFRRVIGMASTPQEEASARAEYGDGDGFTPAQWEHIEDRIQAALTAERQRIHARLLEAAKGLGGSARAAVEAVAGVIKEES